MIKPKAKNSCLWVPRWKFILCIFYLLPFKHTNDRFFKTEKILLFESFWVFFILFYKIHQNIIFGMLPLANRRGRKWKYDILEWNQFDTITKIVYYFLRQDTYYKIQWIRTKYNDELILKERTLKTLPIILSVTKNKLHWRPKVLYWKDQCTNEWDIWLHGFSGLQCISHFSNTKKYPHFIWECGKRNSGTIFA